MNKNKQKIVRALGTINKATTPIPDPLISFVSVLIFFGVTIGVLWSISPYLVSMAFAFFATNYILLILSFSKINTRFGYFSPSRGSSMLPFLPPGFKFVLMQPSNSIHVGDVVSFKRDGQRNKVLHRVIEVRENVVITRGDNNNIVDEPVDKENVIGKVVLSTGRPVIIPISLTPIVLTILQWAERRRSTNTDTKT